MGSNARVVRFRLGDRQYAALSVDAPPAPATPALTEAERDVVEQLIAGKSNRQIAKARKTSDRTVANQVASLFRKLQVSSRAELVARLR